MVTVIWHQAHWKDVLLVRIRDRLALDGRSTVSEEGVNHDRTCHHAQRFMASSRFIELVTHFGG